MTLWLKFTGWFQCRLATDPDPTDEPRGVSGYMRSVAGEPDLDRIIRLQPTGAVPRSHCPPIGVAVVEVLGGMALKGANPLLGAAVELLDAPKFEGRNHVTAQDGFEAIFPLHIRVTKDRCVLQRKYDDTLSYPPKVPGDAAKFAGLKATGINMSAGAIAEATGIYDLASVWADRQKHLQDDWRASYDPAERAALAARIASMEIMDNPGSPNPRPANAKYFPARMLYSMRLSGGATILDPDHSLPGAPSTGAPWTCDFWMGAWDADALSGYTIGYLGIPLDAVAEAQTAEIGAALSDPRLRRG